ncbi:MAG TPA: hypothetical protein VF511_03490, partial [Chthoniobacterales bacterium]
MLSIRRFFSLVFLVLAFGSSAQAITLDWDAVTWTPGTLTNNYDIDPSRAGSDITVTVSGNTTQLQTELASPNPMTPAVTKAFQGGLAKTENSLCLAVNFTDQTQFLTVAVNFSALYTSGVTNVSFTIFDVDFSNASGNTFQDQLRSIQAIDINGNAVAATITTTANNTASGTGLNQVVTGTATGTDTGTSSGSSNVTIS